MFSSLIRTPLISKRAFTSTAGEIFKKSCYSKIDYKIHQHAPVQEAVVRFSVFDIGCLAVVDDNDKLVGIFSEGDFIKRVASVGLDSSVVKVKEVCTHAPNIIIIKPEEKLEECMGKMHIKNIRHLVLTDNQELKGLISIKDLFRETINKNEEIINRLANFNLGKGAYFGSE